MFADEQRSGAMVVGIATRNEEGVVKAVVVTQWQWEMQHEIRCRCVS